MKRVTVDIFLFISKNKKTCERKEHMKKIIGIIIVLICSLNFSVGTSNAATQNNYDLEKVTLGLLHPSIVTALNGHYGGFTQFQNQRIVKIVPKQIPADAEYDSSFKATGWAYEITLKLEALTGEK
jgi:hypothetical protein